MEKSKIESSSTGKKAYLVTDPGFISQLVANLIWIGCIVLLSWSVPAIRTLADNLYFDINHLIMATAHRYALWSLLGLLSSSCCALQLLLNAMSMGCAGFNNVLGPIRPFLLALTVSVQLGSWYVAWSRPWQWIPTVHASVFILLLSFMPEILLAYTTWKANRRISSHEIYKNSTTSRSKVAYNFKMTSVGCSACIAAVFEILHSLDGVEDFEASMEQGILRVKCHGEVGKECIVRSLEDAGFPMISI